MVVGPGCVGVGPSVVVAGTLVVVSVTGAVVVVVMGWVVSGVGGLEHMEGPWGGGPGGARPGPLPALHLVAVVTDVQLLVIQGAWGARGENCSLKSKLEREHSIFSGVLTKAVASY